MAKLYFYYGAMNAGKSTHLLQAAHNYEERGMKVLTGTYSKDSRSGEGFIKSRLGLTRAVDIIFDEEKTEIHEKEDSFCGCSCVFFDEAHFLKKNMVHNFNIITEVFKIPVICYGLRTDFRGELFEGSAALLALADEIIEIKSICHCGKKATMQARIDSEGNRVRDGEQVMIGGNESYVSLCRKHFYE